MAYLQHTEKRVEAVESPLVTLRKKHVDVPLICIFCQ